MEQTPHIAILPSPGMGHLIPFIALAKLLVGRHNFSVTVIVPTTGSPTKAELELLEALPKGINYTFLSPVSFEDLPEDSAGAVQVFLTTKRSLPSLRDTLKSLTASTKLVALVVDIFSTDAFDVANEFDVSSYLFFIASAMTLSYCIHLPKLDETVSGEFRDLPEGLKIPGCIPVPGKDLLDPLLDRTSEVYKWFLHHTKQYSFPKGILLNSFMELEEGAIKALQLKEPGRPPIYPIGPLIQTGSSSGLERPECLQWLDNQPSGSVLFVSFGSRGILSYDQVNELALGLEMSGQRFLWVVRSPNDKSSNVHSQNNRYGFLPEGFLDRTKGQGLVVSSWAPQIEVLGHGSTGGFLTHCGWNSTLESVVHGVPLIAWPLYAEQKMNAIMLTDDLKVALRPNSNENGLVGREEVAKVVKGLMEEKEGKKIRDRMKELKGAAMEVLSEEGSSTESLANLAIEWKNIQK